MKNKIKNIMILIFPFYFVFSNTILAVDLKEIDTTFNNMAFVTYVYDKISKKNFNIDRDNKNFVGNSDINITIYIILMFLSIVVIVFLIYKVRKLNSRKDN